MNEYADQLVMALRSTEFVEPVSWDVDPVSGATKAMCRIPKDRMKEWASLAHQVLLGEASAKGTPGEWFSHICRLYMLREDKLIYGWMFCVTPRDVAYLAHTMDIVCRVIARFSSHAKTPVLPKPARPGKPPPNNQEGAYSPPFEADAAGNPLVPGRQSPKEVVVPMAGLPANYDRNKPRRGRGTYKVESTNEETFVPPRRR